MAMNLRHRSLIGIGGGLASALFMYLAVRRLDYAALWNALRGIALWPWVPLAVLAYVAGHLVRGLRCRLLLRHEANLRLLTAANVVVVGYAANNVFPARMGELVRAAMLSERTGIPVVQSLTMTLIERVLDGLAILALLVIGLAFGDAPEWATEVAEMGLVVFGLAFVTILLAVQTPGLLLSLASRAGNHLSHAWHERLLGLASSVLSAGASLRRPREMLQLAACSVAVWVLEAAMFVAILPAFGLPPDPTLGAVAMSITNLGLLVPSTPGFIGPFHYFCSQVLIASGVSGPVGLAYAGVVHLAFYLPVTAWGALAMLWYGVEVGAAASVARSARSTRGHLELDGLLVHEIGRVDSQRGEDHPSAFETALVEAMVAPPDDPVDVARLARTAAFVHGQIQALPRRLSVLLEAGMTVFRTATRLRYLRGYCDLPLDQRREWTAAWAQGRFGILRQLFKPMRATALLAYHDTLAELSAASERHLHSDVRAVIAPRRLLQRAGRG